MHERSLRAFMLSELPAAVRPGGHWVQGAQPMPVQLVGRDIMKSEVLELHRR